MQTTPRPVVVAVGRRGSVAAVEYAAHESLRQGCGLHVVHAAGPVEAGGGEHERDGAVVIESALERLATLLPGHVHVTSTLALAAAVPAVVAAATDAPLVVVGRCPESRWTHPYVRSITGGVAARVQSPVVSVPDGWRGGSAHVVVGVDDPEDSSEVLIEAFAAACALGARLTVVSTWWRAPGSNDRALTQVEDRARSEHLRGAIERRLADLRPSYDDVPVEVRVSNARPGEALIEISAGAALCVLGRHDPLLPTGSRLGPVARSVLRDASCPVLLAAPRQAHRIHRQQPQPA